MSEIVGGCASQFHNDEDRFELLLVYADGREIGHSVSRSGAVLLAKEIDAALGGEYADTVAAKDAEIARLREALGAILANHETIGAGASIFQCTTAEVNAARAALREPSL